MTKNIDTDQLHCYRAADLRLCFSHMQKAGFLMSWLIYEYHMITLTVYRWQWIKLTQFMNVDQNPLETRVADWPQFVNLK